MAAVVTPLPLSPMNVPFPQKKRLPAGQPRAWYESHNRRLKAMRLATALLDAGVYHPAHATDARIRAIAPLIGVRRPSDVTCRMVRSLMRY
ncbi:hypothetical protein [Streptomyces sp. 7-21]|uniref:hypothetical protein n=1 Tax=Streptomyces sp. 7-21 TaxID=2802283 RepID=UPI00191EE2F6|nr:hypothetical protein [Streptomyces sp. 7-21]MBL1068033.1 hypothetical protein [Streptomyces sp. 7-21]